MSAPPSRVAVLCGAAWSRAAAGAVALALARAAERPYTLASALGAPDTAAVLAVPAARRAAAHLREHRLPATASGRLVRLADRRGQPGDTDVAGAAAALCAELARAAHALGVPAAVALPLARTDALDRVLAWHDAIVVVPQPDACAAVVERVLPSLAALGRPVAALAPPARAAGVLAAWGLQAPAEAADAVATLGLAARPLAEPGDG